MKVARLLPDFFQQAVTLNGLASSLYSPLHFFYPSQFLTLICNKLYQSNRISHDFLVTYMHPGKHLITDIFLL